MTDALKLIGLAVLCVAALPLAVLYFAFLLVAGILLGLAVMIFLGCVAIYCWLEERHWRKHA